MPQKKLSECILDCAKLTEIMRLMDTLPQVDTTLLCETACLLADEAQLVKDLACENTEP